MIMNLCNDTNNKKDNEIEENLLKTIINQSNFKSLFLKCSQRIKTFKDLVVLTKLFYDPLLKQQQLQCAIIKNKDEDISSTQVLKKDSYNALRNMIKIHVKSSSSIASPENSDELQS